MKSKAVQRLLRALITLLGAGVGAALTLGALQLYTMARPGSPVPLRYLILSYTGMALLGGVIFFFLSNAIIAKCLEWGAAIEKRLDNMPFNQILSSTFGLICGLVIAALVSQILVFMGESIFTTAFSAILYVVLGATGYSIGRHRSQDFGALMGRSSGGKGHRFSRKHRKAIEAAPAPACPPKVLDTSVIIDGRILEVCRTGFIEGELVIPHFVLGELRHIADSSDPLRRTRGRRGLDILAQLQSEPSITVRTDETDYDDLSEVDVKLLRLAQDLGGVILTGDYNLNKVAAVAGVRTLNLNELAGALRPAVLPGEEMTVQIIKEGKEPGQGVAYMPDGTMIVVEGGRGHVGETVAITVSTMLQTNAGRMIFAKIKMA